MIYKDVYIVSKSTGEVLDCGDAVLPQKGGVAKFYSNNEVKFRPDEKFESQGNFIWSIYDGTQTFYPEIDKASLTRLIYMSTYLSYDGYLRDGKKVINKNMLIDYLGLKKATFYRFWNNMVNLGIISEQDDKIYLRKDMFFKGSIDYRKVKKLATKDNRYVTRIFSAGTRNLYSSLSTESDRLVSYLYRILPYVHRDCNVCCFNPTEIEIKKIEPFKMADFAYAVGYSMAHACVLVKKLESLTINTENGKEQVLKRIPNSSGNKLHGIFINPHLYYAGDYWSDVYEFCQF